ncbi:hypothetical protein PO878_04135 [Iamia majanohamensis]|uniref:Uncharacterized protein n=1 Tax=Iamia majanohamensis TaxID=467976 RepID=A0AAF0BUK5_9ACTN|nr:hypothetical protein [Iamia majanohamensis]WCO67912.1 hypothetical protein PO878_04135 [Iamia majanohamensis]
MKTTQAKRLERVMEACDCTPDEWVGRVEAGDIYTVGASTWVCDRPAHRAAAEGYVAEVIGEPARFIPRVAS